jgi:hypothetical protein
MLGLLNPGRTDLTYRSLYSRCCQFQHLEYGVLSLPLHTFESVFLYAVACDAGAVDSSSVPRQVCCRLRASRSLERAPDREVARFCASFSLLAAENKSADALRDWPGLLASTRHRLFSSRFERAREYFQSLDSAFPSVFDGFIREHLEFEREGLAAPLKNYCGPTASAFAYTFGLLARLARRCFKGALSEVGWNIGSAILAFDSAQDWEQDQSDGQFNVVYDSLGAQKALEYCLDRLADAQNVCEASFGRAALSAGILERVGARIAQRSSLRRITGDQCDRRGKGAKSVVLNAVCCCPCGDGAVAVDSDEFGKLFCGCCCLAVCAMSAFNGKCCCC